MEHRGPMCRAGVFLFGIPIPHKPWRAAGDLHGLRALSFTRANLKGSKVLRY
jgi:hypothetical protein